MRQKYVAEIIYGLYVITYRCELGCSDRDEFEPEFDALYESCVSAPLMVSGEWPLLSIRSARRSCSLQEINQGAAKSGSTAI